MAERETQVQLQIYLLKESVASAKDAQRDLKVIIRDLPAPLEGILVTRQSFMNTPKWAGFLEDGMGIQLEELKSTSASALVLLKSSGRWFAVSYGYGRTFLDPSKIERRFGMKVVLNCIDPDQVRSIDSRTVEEMTFHTRRQASRTSDVSAFRLDASRDLLRGVTGIPRDSSLASRISGAESVTVSAQVTMADLPTKCAELLAVYGGEEYKQRFAWIDNLQLVSDPDEIKDLDAALDAALSSNATDRMHLAPPETLDWENVSGFYYWDPENSSRFVDLDIDDALSIIRHNSHVPLTAESLHRRHLWVEYREQEIPLARFTMHSCLVFETDIDDRMYVLSDGDWHCIDVDWADGVRRRVERIRSADEIGLPESSAGEVESVYNERAAAAIGATLLDRCIVRYGPSGDQFEVCDILTPQGQLVHVKRKTQSATLSHLFNQGVNSAGMLAHDADFRRAAHDAAAKNGIDLTGVFPVEGVIPNNFEVVFGIVAKPNSRWPRSLPFFSQLSLSEATRNLENLGYRVALTLIPTVDQPTH